MAYSERHGLSLGQLNSLAMSSVCVPSQHLTYHPRLAPALPEFHNRYRHVDIAVLVHADTVRIKRAQKPGHARGVNEIGSVDNAHSG